MLNPELNSVFVEYIYFMPYDYVTWGIDAHVGDLEHTNISFEKGTPTVVRVFHHGNMNEKAYEDVERVGKHPIVYNAAGTHATYFDVGIHLPQFEWTYPGVNWDLWKSLDIVFPWDYTKERF